MKNNLQQFFWGFTALFCLVIGGWRCTKAGAAANSTTPVAYVSIINGAAYGPAADVYLNSTEVSGAGGIPADEYSSEYGAFAPGNYAVTFDKDGTDSVLYSIPSSPFDTLSYYTLILYNASPGGTGVIDGVKITDDFSTTSETQANYRFFNLSPDVPSCDFYISGTQVQGSRTPVDFVFNTQDDAFQTITAGTYSLEVMVAGTDSVLASLSAKPTELSPGNVYTIFLSGTNTVSGGNHLTINVQQAIQ